MRKEAYKIIALQALIRQINIMNKIHFNISFIICILVLLCTATLTSCSKFDTNINADWENVQICLIDGIPYAKREDEKNLVQLGDKIPAPKEWSQQDLAGRNKETTLAGNPEIISKFVSKDSAWLLATYGRGVGTVDVYLYKTSDGGQTWQEVEAPDIPWYPAAVGFINEERLLVASKRFENAPVFLTKDGGKSWDEIQLPDETSVVTSIQVTADKIIMSTNCEYGKSQIFLSSSNMGDSWQMK